MFEAISEALLGIFILVASFLPALTETLPKFLKSLPSPPAWIVLSLTVIDFFSATNWTLTD